MMSNEWKMVRLGDVCEYIRNGANIKQSDNAGGIPITRIETLSNDKFNRDRLGYADISDDKYSKYYLNNHDILMSHINSEKYLGRAVLYMKDSEDETIIHGMNLLSLRTLNDKVIAPFLVYYFATVSFKSQITKISKKSVNQASFSVSCLNKVNIPLPSIKRQREIAAVLDKASELVEKRKAQLAELDRLAESIFYDMFGDPVTNPKDWEKKKFSVLGEITTGNTPSRQIDSYYDEDYIEWIKTDNILNGAIHPTTAKEYLSSEGFGVGRSVNTNSLLITCIAGSLKSIGTVCLTDRAVAFNQQINAFTPNVDVCNHLFMWCLVRFSKKYIQDNATKGMKRIITKSVIEKLSFINPPLPLQHQFAERIEKIEEQKQKVKTALKESEDLFQRLMQDMFNPEYHN